MIDPRPLVFAAVLALVSGPASADELPPIPQSLLNHAGVACIKVSGEGVVTDAFVISTTGSPEGDRDMLGWVKQLHWDNPGDALRDRWSPITVSFGRGPSPSAPAKCGPPPSGEEAPAQSSRSRS